MNDNTESIDVVATLVRDGWGNAKAGAALAALASGEPTLDDALRCVAELQTSGALGDQEAEALRRAFIRLFRLLWMHGGVWTGQQASRRICRSGFLLA